MAGEFQVSGTNADAQFSLKLHRGDGMTLLAMNWRSATPPADFVGFAIEYKEPNGQRFYAVKNRVAFPGVDGAVDKAKQSSLQSPIQKFRWVHFPRNADMDGEFIYRVTPVFMNAADELSLGIPQTAAIELRRHTYPGQVNVAFTRGFISSQGFVDRYLGSGQKMKSLLPPKADDGLDFKPTHPDAEDARDWMGFEARQEIRQLLVDAAAANADVKVLAYDLSEGDIVDLLEALGSRLKIIIDDKGDHGAEHSAETQAEARLRASAGADNVKRQHVGGLQHNKVIIADGPSIKKVLCGSTNFSWRGFYVQSNNALLLEGEGTIAPFLAAFDNYWALSAKEFAQTVSTGWIDLGLSGIDAKVSFSPHAKDAPLLADIAEDVRSTESSLFYSLAFLYQTPGPMLEAIKAVTARDDTFSVGISDEAVEGLDVQMADGKVGTLYPSALTRNLPAPFKKEPTAGNFGSRMHHKFIVIDFDKPTARVYLGSYNFSDAADQKNGENLVLIRDRRIAISYMIEAMRMFDHYRFRVLQEDAKTAKDKLQLSKPPRKPGDVPWWARDYEEPHRIKDRLMFA